MRITWSARQATTEHNILRKDNLKDHMQTTHIKSDLDSVAAWEPERRKPPSMAKDELIISQYARGCCALNQKPYLVSNPRSATSITIPPRLQGQLLSR